jgi:twitching motility two-component system response regulator PilH
MSKSSLILVVDDNDAGLLLTCAVLQLDGFRVDSASSSKEVLERLHSRRPDLILMDVVMPGLNGFQATRAISRDPATRSVPIILCTSKTQETDKIWGMRQGARDYIVKPVNRDELIAKITALG